MSATARDLWPCWDTAAARLSGPAPLLACFDYDGTLVGIRPTPEEAVASDEVREALAALARAPGTTVAVVSGRPLESLRAMIPGASVWRVGRHGISVEAPGEPAHDTVDVAVATRALDPLRRVGEAIVRERPGTRLEDKGAALALHTRAASHSDAAVAAETFDTEAARLEGFEVLVGKEIHEVRPKGADKGRAVAAIRARVAPGGRLLYVGDDTTDEDVFAAVPAGDPSVVTVRVGGGEPTRAAYRVGGPDDVLELLRRLARLRTDRSTA